MLFDYYGEEGRVLPASKSAAIYSTVPLLHSTGDSVSKQASYWLSSLVVVGGWPMTKTRLWKQETGDPGWKLGHECEDVKSYSKQKRTTS